MTDATNSAVKDPTHVTETELWQLRALDAQGGKIDVEIQLLQQRGIEVENQMKTLIKTLREKYGDAQVGSDGKLVYAPRIPMPIPGVAGRPEIPLTPVSEPEDDDEEEEEEDSKEA